MLKVRFTGADKKDAMRHITITTADNLRACRKMPSLSASNIINEPSPDVLTVIMGVSIAYLLMK
ncbi:hypothetical protein [Candidatus Magnetominusculus dajiuhuensis]|uniref:hypothetical protein n=1 Tax=Candidatus Magnetominusculus dajiuhuensis TaxID=3137712 RepID=UPI003B437E52